MEIHEFLPGLYGGGRLDLDPRCWSFIRSHIDVVVNLRTEPDSPPSILPDAACFGCPSGTNRHPISPGSGTWSFCWTVGWMTDIPSTSMIPAASTGSDLW